VSERKRTRQGTRKLSRSASTNSSLESRTKVIALRRFFAAQSWYNLTRQRFRTARKALRQATVWYVDAERAKAEARTRKRSALRELREVFPNFGTGRRRA
jgi:hypothetical protein